jgi:hypothetical protein
VDRRRLEHLDLPGVIQVVRGDAGHRVKHRGLIAVAHEARELGVAEPGNGRAQRAMRVVEQAHVGVPLGGGVGRLPPEEVRSLQGKTAARLAGEPPHHGVLPVGAVHHQFGDVVPAAGRTPRRLRGRDPANRPAQIGAVPGVTVVGAVENVEELGDERLLRHEAGRVKLLTRTISATSIW